MMNTNLEKLLEDFPFIKGKVVAVALSGGADSVALLHFLYTLKDSLDIKLKALHINHSLRGKESDRDEKFCASLCFKYCIPIEAHCIDVMQELKPGESVELGARRIRYEIFEKCDADFIATAHTAEDCLETFLINFLRGTGLKGLCGIPKKRGRFIRPFHSCSRAEIEEYCLNNSLEFVTDSSNLSDDYTRNKIRHNVVPELKKINPAIISVSSRNLKLLDMDNDFITSEVKKEYKSCYVEGKGIDVSYLLKLHPAPANRIIIKYFYETCGIWIEQFHAFEIYRFCKLKKGKIQIKKDVFGVVSKGYLFAENNDVSAFSTAWEILSTEDYKKQLKINNLFLYNSVDCDKICGELKIRSRKPGDRISPVGRGLTKDLRKLQNEKGIDKKIRDLLPVAADDLGPFWCYLTGIDRRVKIDESTKRVLVFKCKKEG